MDSLVRADDTVYTPEEIAEYAKCSASLVRKEIKKGKLKGHRLGGRLLRAKGREVHAWLESQSPKSASTALPASEPGNSGVSNGEKEISVRDTSSMLASIALKEKQRQH